MILIYLRKMALLCCLVLFSSYLQSQTFQELYQGFEGNANDTWNVTPTPAAYSSVEDEDFWTASTATSEIPPAVGAQFWYMQDLDNPNGGFDGFHTLDFETIDVSSFPFNSISFKYYSIAYENTDSIGYIITVDGVEGDFVDLDRNTEAWETVFINLPGGINTVSFRLMAKQNGGSDFAGFDDVFITSSDIDILPPTVLSGTLIDENTVRITYNEPMNEASVTDPANYTIAATIDNITYTEPGDGTSYVDIIFTEPFVDGQQYILSVGLVFDASGNFFLDGFIYTFVYNNSTPNLVITEIMYHPPGSDDLEFVEVYNAGDETAAIGGLTFTITNDFIFPVIDLAPGEVILLAQFEADAEAFYGMDFYDWGVGALGNGGGTITISNDSGQIIDEVSYDDAAPWPVEADGDGPSLELIAPSLDNALASSWRATTTQFSDTESFATPGTISDELPPVVAFDENVISLEEGSGAQSLGLSISNPNMDAVEVVINVASASTAIEGVDFNFTSSTTITFAAGSSDPQSLGIELLDNDAIGGHYLILEITNPVNASIGTNGKIIMLIKDNDDETPVADANAYIQLNHLGSFDLGGDNVAEIVAYDGETQRLFVTNSEANTVEAINYSDPANLTLDFTLFLELVGGGVNSVAVHNGIVAIAVEGDNTGDNGFVVFTDTDGNDLGIVPVGFLPDMVTFTPDGTKVLTANEGEPNDDYSIDPEGSVSIIDISNGVANATVNTIGFTDFNSQQAVLIEQGVRLFGPDATVAQDLEPEYIAISPDGAFAYVSCQENNAVAIVDIEAEAVSTIFPLGAKDWTEEGVTFDASNSTDDIFFANWPIRSYYQPDGGDFFTAGGAGYLISANEGDARDYDAYSEEARIGDDEIILDPMAFPDAEYLKDDALLGRLKMTTANGDTDGDGDFDEIYAYGGRSFSIWNATTGDLVYDSGNDLEQITAADPIYGALFNSDDEENVFKDRSDDKGPEPEAVITAEIDGRQFAFIGLERTGGIMVYNVSNPEAPVFLQYINTRTVDSPGGDLSPEGLAFIPAEDSPSGKPLLTVAYEVSGTIGVFELDLSCPIISIPDEVTVCDGDVALLEVSGQYSDIIWSTGEEGSSIIVEEAGEITVMATTAGGCMAFDTVMVAIIPNPIVNIISGALPCEGETVVLSVSDTFVDYEWSTGDTTQTIEISTSGTYGVTVTDQNGCEGFEEGTISFLDSPVFDFPTDTVICVFDVFVYTPQEGDILIINGSQVDNLTIEGFEVGTYSVVGTLVGPEGCDREVEFNFSIDVCGSTNEELVAEQISVFPNPTSGVTNVRLSQLQASRYQLEVLNITGQLIEGHTINNVGVTFNQELDLTAISSGVYFIRLSNDKGIKIHRLIVE